MKNKKISIIIPIYNSERKIKKCVDSILNQSYRNIEIILVDDGSKDNSPTICDEYAKYDKRIKVYHKKNGGVSSARNLGLDKATGDYISFVDSDDYIETNMYEKLYNIIYKRKSDIVICNIFFEDEKNKVLYNYNYKSFDFKKEEYPEYSYYITSISGYTCNKLYSKDTIYYKDNSHINFDSNIVIAEDDLFNYKILDKNNKINYSYIDEKLYHYSINMNGAINKKFDIKKLTYFDAKEKEIEILKKIKINNDFIKADYIINQVRTNIIMNKLNIASNRDFDFITSKSKKYLKEIKYFNLKYRLILKLFIATKFPIIYKIKLRNAIN